MLQYHLPSVLRDNLVIFAENNCPLKLEVGTLHGFVLHWSDVFKARWGDIPVLLHLLLLLTVRRATFGGKKSKQMKQIRSPLFDLESYIQMDTKKNKIGV